MNVLVVGGTGHIGSYLVPRLVAAGHEVTVIARRPQPQFTHPRLGWPRVQWMIADRLAEEATGAWAKRMQSLETDVVIDTIAYKPEQNRVMVESFRGRIRQFIHIGSIWAYGPAERVPYEESDPRHPISSYGRNKAQIEADLQAEWRAAEFPATILHPGHICGRKWLPIDPQGSRDGVAVYRALALGEPVVLPERGATTLHHVHADDIGQLCERAMVRRQEALGESFSAVAPYGMSLAGCCRAVANLFGREPNLRFVPLTEIGRYVGAGSARTIEEHVKHSPCVSIAKGQNLLDYQPRYTTEQIYAESIEYLLESEQLALS